MLQNGGNRIEEDVIRGKAKMKWRKLLQEEMGRLTHSWFSSSAVETNDQRKSSLSVLNSF